MKKEHVDEIQGIVVLALGLILLASLLSFVPDDLSWYTSHPNVPAKNLIRIVGAYLAGTLLFVFGQSAYFLSVFLFFVSWNKFSGQDIQFNFSKFISSVVLMSVISAFLGMSTDPLPVMRFERAGMVGLMMSDFFLRYLGQTGSYIILTTVGILTFILTGEFLISPLLIRLAGWGQELFFNLQDFIAAQRERVDSRRKKPGPRPPVKMPFAAKSREPVAPRPMPKDNAAWKAPDPEDESPGVNAEKVVDKPAEKPRIRITKSDDEGKRHEPPAEPKIVGTYVLPHMDLLADPPSISTSKIQSDLEEGARTLETTLADFNVSVRVADIERGPVITRFELEPAPGVKVQQITTLADDIALAMKAPAVRIVAPIPGKNRVGIEVPNSSKASVYLKEVLTESNFQNSRSKLMLAIGKDIAGSPIIADLSDMPHLLIAGTTGSGKSVCVNALIMSILFNATPNEVRFLMVDPKMVELSQYNDISHMLCPAVTDHKKVAAALNWIVGEMESRYQILSKAGVKNIKAYHAQGHVLPYIVVIIDELADLMQVSAKTIESAITRLAQLSRAVGIHLILATQRPSVDVITGVIKANFPARVSFKVASKVDSRTVLDMNGAETLLGKGDLLFMKPGDAKPTRGQCSFVSDQEVQTVINFIKGQQTPQYDESILTQQRTGAAGGDGEKDELYDEAVKVVIETSQASVSILQRRMRLGYTRAARLIDMMEQEGVVGPYCGSKAREILVDREEWMMQHMNTKESGNDPAPS